MRYTTIIFYEWMHFIRTPFKVVALSLYALAAIYALQNGATLYQEQISKIEAIRQKAEEEKLNTLAIYEDGKNGPENRPWVNLTAPYWAISYATPNYFKRPSPTLIYNVGQAEQYGFYKKVTLRSSPLDADMVEEIANPERLQSGTLDFSFVTLYLLPLLLLILTYNIKGAEFEMGFLPMVYAQVNSKVKWLISRMIFYFLLLSLISLGLIIYGGALTNALYIEIQRIIWLFFYSILYLLLWSFIYFLILRSSKDTVTNTLKMVGLWLIVSFLLPATINQLVSNRYPANLMTDWIDAQREERKKLLDRPDSVLLLELKNLYPEILNSSAMVDKEKIKRSISQSSIALSNELMKKSIAIIEQENSARNNFINNTSWLNPVTFFQNQLNAITKTHYNDYYAYRQEIQKSIDAQINKLVVDTWNEKFVDKKDYQNYYTEFSQE